MFTPSPASPGCRSPSWACRPPRCRGRRCRGRARAGGWPAWSPPRRCSPGAWVNIFPIKKYFSATHPAHNLRVLEDLLLDHGEAALHEGSVSSSVPRHAFILNLKNRMRSEKMVYMFRMHRMYRLNSVKNTNFFWDRKKIFLTHWKTVFWVTEHFFEKSGNWTHWPARASSDVKELFSRR